MLLETKEREIPILEIPIETVYIDDNKSSHFNPIKDSMRIYSLFLKYILASMFSFLVDIALFTLFVSLFRDVIYDSYVYVATVLARAISSFVNYRLNLKSVFKSKNTSKKQAVTRLLLYYGLVIVNVLISAFLVDLAVKGLHLQETLIKIVVDTCLFVMNYFIQRDLLFRKKS